MCGSTIWWLKSHQIFFLICLLFFPICLLLLHHSVFRYCSFQRRYFNVASSGRLWHGSYVRISRSVLPQLLLRWQSLGGQPASSDRFSRQRSVRHDLLRCHVPERTFCHAQRQHSCCDKKGIYLYHFTFRMHRQPPTFWRECTNFLYPFVRVRQHWELGCLTCDQLQKFVHRSRQVLCWKYLQCRSIQMECGQRCHNAEHARGWRNWSVASIQQPAVQLGRF